MQQGHLVDLVQREVKSLLQSALEIALSVVRANPDVLEGLGAHLEGDILYAWDENIITMRPCFLSLFWFLKNLIELELEIISCLSFGVKG